jgi:hypothetical protein
VNGLGGWKRGLSQERRPGSQSLENMKGMNMLSMENDLKNNGCPGKRDSFGFVVG